MSNKILQAVDVNAEITEVVVTGEFVQYLIIEFSTSSLV